MFKTLVKSTLSAALASTLLTFTAQADEIKVGGKNFTEQLLLAEITSELLEAKGFDVAKLDGMGTSVLRAAQENGQVDIYWEYTGTSLITFNKIEDKLTAEETYAKVKELDAQVGITWLDASNANNTYALAVRAADDKGLSTLSDLAAAYNGDTAPKMGVNAEFPKRPDGLPGLEETYGFDIGRKDIAPMQSGLIYDALKGGQVDVGLVFATDGRIAAFDFKVLADDKGFFPAYAITPTIRTEVLEAHPEIGVLLNGVSAVLTDDLMQSLNARVDVDKETIEDVASSFLAEQGLI
ncbi:glycine/betaine ABC transporter substrate-binding protein [Epibacterium sp. SM1979]|uniref:Glycine/betaine ABC transporter substrate-binding protein n=1 Tax=Tritonibacter litoralis TaxID=2662264 RepID=A0A843YDN2_9RHOB|nr:glycine betaine ABC transporter substrate-binding protein [Tritonibacter litoralis]MQQ07765.1 glycine/betaine ABC transporter substrate-binding protein [Tritonibacter litoralis]